MTRYNTSKAGGMNFTPAQQFQMNDPEKYRYKREQAIASNWTDERGNKIRKIKDTWWFVNSTSSTSTNYLLHIHEDATFYLEKPNTSTAELTRYNHPSRLKNPFTGKKIPIRGRIECECKSFIYSKLKPRCCKHTIELARRFFGEKSMQYLSLTSAVKYKVTEEHSGDEWCNHLAKVETMDYYEGKMKPKKYHTHAEKILAQQEGKWK